MTNSNVFQSDSLADWIKQMPKLQKKALLVKLPKEKLDAMRQQYRNAMTSVENNILALDRAKQIVEELETKARGKSLVGKWITNTEVTCSPLVMYLHVKKYKCDDGFSSFHGPVVMFDRLTKTVVSVSMDGVLNCYLIGANIKEADMPAEDLDQIVAKVSRQLLEINANIQLSNGK